MRQVHAFPKIVWCVRSVTLIVSGKYAIVILTTMHSLLSPVGARRNLVSSSVWIKRIVYPVCRSKNWKSLSSFKVLLAFFWHSALQNIETIPKRLGRSICNNQLIWFLVFSFVSEWSKPMLDAVVRLPLNLLRISARLQLSQSRIFALIAEGRTMLTCRNPVFNNIVCLSLRCYFLAMSDVLCTILAPISGEDWDLSSVMLFSFDVIKANMARIVSPNDYHLLEYKVSCCH